MSILIKTENKQFEMKVDEEKSDELFDACMIAVFKPKPFIINTDNVLQGTISCNNPFDKKDGPSK